MKRRGNRVFVAAGLVVVFAMMGCGSSSSGTASSTSQSTASSTTAASEASVAPAAIVHACDLLTPDIAKKFLGASAVRTIKAQPNPHMTHCHYNGSRGSIDVMVGDTWSMINVGQEHVSGEKAMAGLGDEALLPRL